MKRKLPISKLTTTVFMLLSLFIVGNAFGQATFRSNVASGAWNVAGTWTITAGSDGDGIPDADDTVLINGADNRAVVIPTGYSAFCASLTLGDAVLDKVNALTVTDNTSSLTVGNNFDFNRPNGSSTNNLFINAGTVTVNGNFNFVGVATNNNRFAKITITTGVLTILGNLVLNAPTAALVSANDIDMSGGAGKLNLAGTFTLPATGGGRLVNSTTSTFNFNGTTAGQTIPINNTNFNYSNLSINNSHASGATLSAAISATNVTESITVGNVTSGSLLNTNSLAVARGASDTITVSLNSTLDAGTSVISWGGASGVITINGVFKTANTVGFSGNTTTAINTTTNTPTVTLGASSVIDYNAAGAQNVTTRTYPNLKLSNFGNKTIFTGTIITSNLSIAGSAKGLLDNGGTSSAGTLTLGGLGTAAGEWGSTGSTAANKSDIWFVAANSGKLNGIGTSCAAFTAAISGTNSICNGNSTNLAVTITGGTSPFNLIYAGLPSGGATINNYVSASSISVSPGVTTTYSINSVTDSLGCTSTNSGSAVVTVNNPSVAPTSISGTTTICSPNSTTLSAVGGTLGTGANYQWGTGTVVGTSPLVGQTGISLVVTPGSSTTYWVRIENTTGPCTGTTGGVSQLVTVNNPSVAPTSISGTTTICSPNSTTLTAVGGTLGTGANYQWGTGTVVGTSPLVGDRKSVG